MTVAAQGRPLVARDVVDALALLRASGLRVTSARRLLLDALFTVDRPVGADEIAAGLDRAVPPSDLASVYRNLETLEQIGLVRHVHFGHAAGLYELTRGQRHEYALCERCAKVIAVPAGELDEARAVIERVLGIEPSFTHFPLVGRCGACRRERAGERPQERRIHAHS
jgi:Fur family ferric uptake transcriptional regulator